MKDVPTRFRGSPSHHDSGLRILSWDSRVPVAVNDAIACFIRQSPNHDDVRKAEYGPESYIIQAVVVYARFGDWVVKVCDYTLP
jgi:hypothetical protein